MDKTIVVKCKPHKTFSGGMVHVWAIGGRKFKYIDIAGFMVDPNQFRVDAKLTVTISIEEPDAPALNDDAAGKLNTFMNGG